MKKKELMRDLRVDGNTWIAFRDGDFEDLATTREKLVRILVDQYIDFTGDNDTSEEDILLDFELICLSDYDDDFDISTVI